MRIDSRLGEITKRAYILESGHMTRSGASADLIEDADIRRAYLGR